LLLLATLFAAPAFPQGTADLGEKALTPAEAEERGLNYWLGRGVDRDPVEAARWLERAAAGGRPRAAAVLATLYSSGAGVAVDAERAVLLARQAAERGLSQGQSLLAFHLAFRPDPSGRDPAAALPWLRAAAEQEDPWALFILGQMYRYGDLVERDTELSSRLNTRAAELGFPPAAAEAWAYLLRTGATGSEVQRGLYFVRDAATAGYGPATYALGKLYLTGLHVGRDPGLAVQWLTRASDLEVALGTVWLAELYAKGLGVDADLRRATELRDGVLPTMSVDDRNEFGWELAVSPDAELRNGALAVEIMELVTAEVPSPPYLDTLAAAYAEAGRFEDAVRAQQRAVDALPNDAGAETREAITGRVALYRAREPYREAP
jgi:TPR repeat protein